MHVITQLTYVVLGAGGYVNHPFVLSQAQKTHFQMTVKASSYMVTRHFASLPFRPLHTELLNTGWVWKKYNILGDF